MATGTIIEKPDLSAAMSRSKNNEGPTPSIIPNSDDLRPALVEAIWFYNIAPQEFNEPRFPNHPRMHFRACPRDKEYIVVGSISHPFEEFREDQNFNRIPFFTNGYREATKMLCPLNPGTDQDFYDPATLHQGGNLCWLGVFWSTHNPPWPEEVAAARRRLEETYRIEIQDLVAAEAEAGPDAARARANRTSHAAAEYFGQSFSWHRSDLMQNKNAGKVDCWACGEKIQERALICMHCRAPQAEERRERWLDAQTSAPAKR